MELLKKGRKVSRLMIQNLKWPTIWSKNWLRGSVSLVSTSLNCFFKTVELICSARLQAGNYNINLGIKPRFGHCPACRLKTKRALDNFKKLRKEKLMC